MLFDWIAELSQQRFKPWTSHVSFVPGEWVPQFVESCERSKIQPNSMGDPYIVYMHNKFEKYLAKRRYLSV